MTRVLVLAEYYLPGYTAGGPIRTIANLADQLGDQIAFTVLTRHTDARDPRPYADVATDELHRVGKANVYYASPPRLGWGGMRSLLRELPHDVLYLNSLLAPTFSVLPLLLRRLRLVPERPVVLAPRGELDPGALQLKPWRKRAFLVASRLLGLHRGITWQATNEREAEYIRAWFGKHVAIRMVGNLPDRTLVPLEERPQKEPGRVRACFLSRVARKKNLDGALRALHDIDDGQVSLAIYGAREDPEYWAECERLIESLPDNVEATYQGAVPHEHVRDVLASYDLFFFPTHGENYGHAIAEALSAGCPVLISDRTPWQGLEDQQAGWVVDHEDAAAMRSVLARCVEMDEAEWQAWRAGAQRVIQQKLDDPATREASGALFVEAAASAKGRP